MIVSGLASIGGLTLLYVAGGAAMITRNPALLISPRPLAVVAALAALTAVAVVVGRRRMGRPAPDAAGPPPRPDGRIAGFVRKTLESARDGWRAGAALRGRDWVTAVLYAAANWLTDLLCLVATCRAVGLPVGVSTLAGIYLGVQIVRQVPLTPGGVGIIDTALIAGLTAAGATAVTAAAAVLVYRLLSCWLLLPVGGIAGGRAAPRPPGSPYRLSRGPRPRPRRRRLRETLAGPPATLSGSVASRTSGGRSTRCCRARSRGIRTSGTSRSPR